MTDPLSVAASITGILTAAAQLTTALTTFGVAVATATQTANDIRKEVEGIAIVMRALEGFLFTVQGLETQGGAKHIAAVDLAMLIMGCMDTFSRLQQLLDESVALLKLDGNVQRSVDVVGSLLWVLKGGEKELERLRDRLMRQNNVLALMVEIIRCKSEMESRDNLLREFGQKVAEETRKLDQAMSRRLELVAQSCHQSIHWSLPCSPIDTAAANEFSMIRSSLREDESNFVISDSNSANVTVLNETATPAQLVEDHGSETEHNLSGEISPEIWTSYVYKRNRNRFLDSLPSIPAFSRSCESILSGISISRISEIALFELPILAKELYNGAVYRNNASEPTFSTSESCSSPTASNHALDQHKNSPSSIATAVNGKHIDKAAISPPILIGMSHSPRTIELHQAMLMHHPNSPPRTPTSMKVSIGAPTMPLTTCQTPTIELSQALLANSIRLSEPPTRHQRSRSAEINFSLPVAPLVIRKQLSASPVIC